MTKSLLRLPRQTAYSTPLLEAYFNGRLSLPLVTPDEDGARLGLRQAKQVQWNRELLVEVLKEQANQCQAGSKAKRAIDDLIHDHAFTVCTAHQSCLFFGPRYLYYKALSAIKAARTLSSNENPVYPVFWMGSEDHDFEEINHIHWEGQTVQWKHEQGNAVGRMSTDGLEYAIDEVMRVAKASLSSEALQELNDQLDVWKTKEDVTYASLWQMALYQLFQDEELIVINADDYRLKKLFLPIMLNELSNNSLQGAVKESDEGVFAAFSMPLHVRETNLFYFENGVRQRVELDKKNQSQVESWSAQCEQNPEHFSPNVALRPLYQQVVLPNISFVGGPSEVAYWLQLAPAFTTLNVHYPQVLLRDQCIMVSQRVVELAQQYDVSWESLIQGDLAWQDAYLEKTFEEELTPIKDAQTLWYEKGKELSDYAHAMEDGLGKAYVGAWSKMNKLNATLLQKTKRHLKQNHPEMLKHWDQLTRMIQPAGVLQERYASTLSLVAKKDHDIKALLDAFNPFEQGIHIVLDD